MRVTTLSYKDTKEYKEALELSRSKSPDFEKSNNQEAKLLNSSKSASEKVILPIGSRAGKLAQSHRQRRESKLSLDMDSGSPRQSETIAKRQAISLQRRKSIRSIILKPIIEKIEKKEQDSRTKWKQRLRLPDSLDELEDTEVEEGAQTMTRINTRISEEYNKYLAKIKAKRFDMNIEL